MNYFFRSRSRPQYYCYSDVPSFIFAMQFAEMNNLDFYSPGRRSTVTVKFNKTLHQARWEKYRKYIWKPILDWGFSFKGEPVIPLRLEGCRIQFMRVVTGYVKTNFSVLPLPPIFIDLNRLHTKQSAILDVKECFLLQHRFVPELG